MKKIILMMFISIILTTAVFSLDTWEQYQYDDDNTGIYRGEYEGFFNDGVKSFSYKFKGDDTQPIFMDIDNDSIGEYITIHGGDIIIYNVSDQNQLQIQSQFSSGFGAGRYFLTSYKDRLFLLYDNLQPYTGYVTLFIYDWVNDSLSLNQSQNLWNRDISSGLTCDYISQLKGDYCYFYSRTTGGVVPYVVRYNISNNTFIESNVGGLYIYIAETYKKAPVISDINNDGTKWLYMGGSDGSTGSMITRTNTVTLISGNFILTNNGMVTGININDIDGGYEELLISYYETAGNKEGRLSIRNDLFSEMYNICMITNSYPAIYSADISNCLYEDFYGNSDKELCCMGHMTSSNTSAVIIACAIPGDSYALYPFFESYDTTDKYYFNRDIPIISAKMREDINNKYSIVTGSAIFFVDENKVISYDSDDFYGINGLNSNYPIISDINGDSLIDVCSSGNDETFCAFNSFQNQNAFYIGSFGSTTPRKDIQSESNTIIYEDVCIDSIHTFFTAECTDTESFRCNYVNDVKSDTERLLLTCPDGTDIETSFYNNKINFSCNFSILGTYKFPVFLQDNHHLTDLQEFKYIKLNVVNGTEYIDCDLATNIYDKLPQNETETIQEDSEGTDEIPTGTTGIGDYCLKDSDCITGKCQNHICVYRLFNEPCLNDAMCLSGKCINEKCNKPTIAQLANQARAENFGTDDDTNIIIGMLICLGGMLGIIVMGRSVISCVVGGIWYFVSSTIFVMLQWLPSFIFFINIFLGVICIILYFAFGRGGGQ